MEFIAISTFRYFANDKFSAEYTFEVVHFIFLPDNRGICYLLHKTSPLPPTTHIRVNAKNHNFQGHNENDCKSTAAHLTTFLSND